MSEELQAEELTDAYCNQNRGHRRRAIKQPRREELAAQRTENTVSYNSGALAPSYGTSERVLKCEPRALAALKDPVVLRVSKVSSSSYPGRDVVFHILKHVLSQVCRSRRQHLCR